jgi:hypothetical protein
MPAFEILEERGFGATGTFSPKADQSKFVSTFAVINGEKKAGWQDGHTVQTGIPTTDGKARLCFSEFKGGDSKPNDIKINGMVLREFTAPREDAQAKEKYDANLSNEKMRAVSSPVNITASETTVGRTNAMEFDKMVPPEQFRA